MTRTYNVHAYNDNTTGIDWELHIDNVGVTQAETTDEVETMIRDYLDCEGHNPNAHITITWHRSSGSTTPTTMENDPNEQNH